MVGTWRGTFGDEDGSGSMRWEVSSQNGQSFAGTATVTQYEKTGSGALNGTLSGEQVSFRFSLTVCANGCPVEGSAQLDGDQLTGTFTANTELGQPRSGVLTLSRQS
jgi:hypothetical protein